MRQRDIDNSVEHGAGYSLSNVDLRC
jgi:hypothetical protein